MKRPALLVALVSVAGICHGLDVKPVERDFYGKWRVEDVVGYAEVGAGVPYAKKMLGHDVVVSAKGITFDRVTCRPNGGFRVVDVETEVELRTKAGASRTDAELPATVTALVSENCMELFWLDQHRIEFDAGGVFFRAYRD